MVQIAPGRTQNLRRQPGCRHRIRMLVDKGLRGRPNDCAANEYQQERCNAQIET